MLAVTLDNTVLSGYCKRKEGISFPDRNNDRRSDTGQIQFISKKEDDLLHKKKKKKKEEKAETIIFGHSLAFGV